jgi:hypothetical protein
MDATHSIIAMDAIHSTIMMDETHSTIAIHCRQPFTRCHIFAITAQLPLGINKIPPCHNSN